MDGSTHVHARKKTRWIVSVPDARRHPLKKIYAFEVMLPSDDELMFFSDDESVYDDISHQSNNVSSSCKSTKSRGLQGFEEYTEVLNEETTLQTHDPQTGVTRPEKFVLDSAIATITAMKTSNETRRLFNRGAKYNYITAVEIYAKQLFGNESHWMVCLSNHLHEYGHKKILHFLASMLYCTLHRFDIKNSQHRAQAKLARVPLLPVDEYKEIMSLLGEEDHKSSLIPNLCKNLTEDLSRLFSISHQHFEDTIRETDRTLTRFICIDDDKVKHAYTKDVDGIARMIHAKTKKPGSVLHIACDVASMCPLGVSIQLKHAPQQESVNAILAGLKDPKRGQGQEFRTITIGVDRGYSSMKKADEFTKLGANIIGTKQESRDQPFTYIKTGRTGEYVMKRTGSCRIEAQRKTLSSGKTCAITCIRSGHKVEQKATLTLCTLPFVTTHPTTAYLVRKSSYKTSRLRNENEFGNSVDSVERQMLQFLEPLPKEKCIAANDIYFAKLFFFTNSDMRSRKATVRARKQGIAEWFISRVGIFTSTGVNEVIKIRNTFGSKWLCDDEGKVPALQTYAAKVLAFMNSGCDDFDASDHLQSQDLSITTEQLEALQRLKNSNLVKAKKVPTNKLIYTVRKKAKTVDKNEEWRSILSIDETRRCPAKEFLRQLYPKIAERRLSEVKSREILAGMCNADQDTLLYWLIPESKLQKLANDKSKDIYNLVQLARDRARKFATLDPNARLRTMQRLITRSHFLQPLGRMRNLVIGRQNEVPVLKWLNGKETGFMHISSGGITRKQLDFLEVRTAGLLAHPAFPEIGTSVDGICLFQLENKHHLAAVEIKTKTTDKSKESFEKWLAKNETHRSKSRTVFLDLPSFNDDAKAERQELWNAIIPRNYGAQLIHHAAALQLEYVLFIVSHGNGVHSYTVLIKFDTDFLTDWCRFLHQVYDRTFGKWYIGYPKGFGIRGVVDKDCDAILEVCGENAFGWAESGEVVKRTFRWSRIIADATSKTMSDRILTASQIMWNIVKGPIDVSSRMLEKFDRIKNQSQQMVFIQRLTALALLAVYRGGQVIRIKNHENSSTWSQFRRNMRNTDTYENVADRICAMLVDMATSTYTYNSPVKRKRKRGNQTINDKSTGDTPKGREPFTNCNSEYKKRCQNCPGKIFGLFHLPVETSVTPKGKGKGRRKKKKDTKRLLCDLCGNRSHAKAFCRICKRYFCILRAPGTRIKSLENDNKEIEQVKTNMRRILGLKKNEHIPMTADTNFRLRDRGASAAKPLQDFKLSCWNIFHRN